MTRAANRRASLSRLRGRWPGGPEGVERGTNTQGGTATRTTPSVGFADISPASGRETTMPA
jgi:hypothetical protein